MTQPFMTITATGPQGCGKSQVVAAIHAHLVSLGCVVVVRDEDLDAGTHALRVTPPGNSRGGVALGASAPSVAQATEQGVNGPVQAAQPAPAAGDVFARAWVHLLTWAAEAPARYRMPLADLLAMSVHGTACDHTRAVLTAGAARLNAVTMKEGTR